MIHAQLCFQNSPEFLVSWLGLTRIDVIEVPINVAFRGDLLAYILNKSECQVLVISSQWIDRVKDLIEELNYLRHVIVVGDEFEIIPGKITWHSFNTLISQASDATVDVEIKPSDPSLILFTSGTTGPLRGLFLHIVQILVLPQRLVTL